MGIRIPGIYVEIAGDTTQLKQDMTRARGIVRETAEDMSDAIGNALDDDRVKRYTNSLIGNLNRAHRATQVAGRQFDKLKLDLKEVGHVTGLTDREFQQLHSRMLKTQATKTAERALKSLQSQANLTNLQMAKLRLRMGDATGAARTMAGVVVSKFQAVTRTIFNLGTAVAALGVGYAVGEIYDAGKAADQLNRSFKAIFGSTQAASEEMDWLRGVADRLGQNFWDLTDSYKGIAAAARGTSLEGEAVRNVFEAITMASTALGLSSDQTKGALNALAQMISKGTVQAEELRGQLGERLYGAFQVAARAMGVSTEQLGKMLEKGEVLAADFLPRLAAEIKKTYGEEAVKNVNSATAAQNKFSEAWSDFIVEISTSGALDSMTETLRDLTESLKDPDAKDAAKAIGRAMATIVEVGGNALIVLGNIIKKGQDLYDKFNQLTDATEEAQRDHYRESYKEQIARLQEILEKAGDEDNGIYHLTEAGIERFKAKIAELQYKLQELDIQTAESRGKLVDAANATADAWGWAADEFKKDAKASTDAAQSGAKATVKVNEKAAKQLEIIRKKLDEKVARIDEDAFQREVRQLEELEQEHSRISGKRYLTNEQYNDKLSEIGRRATEDAISQLEKEVQAADKAAGQKYEAEKTWLQKTVESWQDYDHLLEEGTKNTVNAVSDAWFGFIDDFDFSLDAIGDSFGDLAGTIFTIWKRMLAQLLAQWTLSGFAGLFSGQGFSGFSLNIAGQAGGSTLASAGNGISSFVSSLFGSAGGPTITDQMGNWLVSTFGNNPAGWTGALPTSTLMGMDAATWSSVLGTAGTGLAAGMAGYTLAPLIYGDDNYSDIGGGLGSAAGAVIGSTLLPGIGTWAGAILGGLAGGGLGSLFGGDDDSDAEEALGYFAQNIQKITSGEDGGRAWLDAINQYEKSDNKARSKYGELQEIYEELRKAGALEWWAPDYYTGKTKGHLDDASYWMASSALGGIDADDLEGFDQFKEAITELDELLGPLSGGLRGIIEDLDLQNISAEDLAATIEERLTPAWLIQNELNHNLADGVNALTAHEQALDQTISSLLGTTDLTAEAQDDLIDLLMRESGSVADLTAKYNRYQEIQGLLKNSYSMSREEVEALVAEGQALHRELGLESNSMAGLTSATEKMTAAAIMMSAAMKGIDTDTAIAELDGLVDKLYGAADGADELTTAIGAANEAVASPTEQIDTAAKALDSYGASAETAAVSFGKLALGIQAVGGIDSLPTEFKAILSDLTYHDGGLIPRYHGGGFIQAAMASGFITEHGGALPRMHTGGLASDELGIIAQRGEFMVQRSAVNAGTLPWLTYLNEFGRVPELPPALLAPVAVPGVQSQRGPTVHLSQQFIIDGDVVGDQGALNRIGAMAAKAAKDGALQALRESSARGQVVIDARGVGNLRG